MDPQQQQNLAGMMAGMGVVIMLLVLVFMVAFVFLFWRIYTKAGLAGPLALLVLVPAIGPLVALCILAFAQWRVVPAPQQYGSFPPQYPPPVNYPPPQGPPSY